MRSRSFLCLSVLVMVFLSTRQALKSFHSIDTKSAEITEAFMDAESRFSLSLPIDFWSSGIYELELIPGISDSMAIRILDARGRIRAEADTLLEEEKFRSLEVVRGIGKKSAEKLKQYLSFMPEANRTIETDESGAN